MEVPVAKQSINMRLDKQILEEAKRVLGEDETTATVEKALANMINNRRAIAIFRKATGKSKWEGFVGREEKT
jgi:hypothetical protein